MEKLTLKVPAEAKEKLRDLQSKTSATTMTEVLRRSLSLYDQIVDLLQEPDTELMIKVNREGKKPEEIRLMII